jgi:hypothetical protein
MKKFLTVLLCFALIFVLAVPTMAAVSITANKANIVLDGVLDDAYAGPIDVATPNRDASGELTGIGAAAATGKAWVAWDGKALYFYIDVTDKTPNHDDFNAESIEIFLDWNAGKGDADEASDAAPFWQIRVSPVEPETLSGYSRDDGGANWSQSEFEDLTEWKIVPKNNYKDGYIVEIKIGAPAIAPLSEGKVIPFDIQVCDNSEGSGRDGQMFLAHVGEDIDDNSRWNTAMHLQGLLTLGGAPSVAAPAAPAAGAGVDTLAAATAGKNALMNPTYITGGDGFNDKEGSASILVYDEDSADFPKYCTDQLPYFVEWKYDKAYVIDNIILRTGGDSAQYPRRMGDGWTLSGSNDGSNWTVIYTGKETDVDNENDMYYTVSLAGNSTAYQYYKLFAAEAGSADDQDRNLIQYGMIVLCGAAGDAPTTAVTLPATINDTAPAVVTPTPTPAANKPAAVKTGDPILPIFIFIALAIVGTKAFSLIKNR